MNERTFSLSLNRAVIDLTAHDDETLAWLASEPVMKVVNTTAIELRLQSSRIVREPRPRQPPPPAGVLYPSLVAMVLLQALKRAFPDNALCIFYDRQRAIR